MSAFKIQVSNSEGGKFELPPSGSHAGCLVGLIDLGTQKDHFEPTKEVHKVLLVFELTGENTSKGETFKVSRDFRLSLNKKANLRAFLEGWDRKYSDSESIDIGSFVGRDCMVNLKEGEKNGKVIVEIASVTKPPKGFAVPPRTVEPFVWTFEGHEDPRHEPPVPEWVPKLFGRKVVDDIKLSREWANLENDNVF